MTFWIIVLIYTIGIRIGTYKIFEKNGIAGWKAFVPFLCSNEWQKLVDKPSWWTFMLLIPGVNLFYWAGQLTRMCTAHGRTSFIDHAASILLAPIYWIWFGFNDNIKYISPTGLKAGQKPLVKSPIREWADAIIFALVAATLLRTFIFEAYTIPTPSMEKTLLVGDFLFVSKFHYGARIPETPLAFPLVHHTLPLLNTQSYSELIKLPYMKLPGFERVSRYDMVVFNYPAGDTVALEEQAMTYYDIVRLEAIRLRNMGATNINPMDYVHQKYHVKARPVDKRENYIKRCVGVAGDKIQVKEGILYVNDQKAYEPENVYLPYVVTLKDIDQVPDEVQDELEIEDISMRFGEGGLPGNHKVFLMRKSSADMLAQKPNIVHVTPFHYNNGQDVEPYENIFPNNFKYYHWNVDNFGPIMIPKKGMVLSLNDSTLCQYRRLIEIYEGNKVETHDGKIFINGTATDQYTCKLDYYWMMGDNRHNSQDSRYWGYVPEDHIVGKAWFIWMSLNYNNPRSSKIRWNRIFTNIHGKWAPSK
jgi:signal peptidase I